MAGNDKPEPVGSLMDRVFSEAAHDHLNPTTIKLLQEAYESRTSPFGETLGCDRQCQLPPDSKVVAISHNNVSSSGYFQSSEHTLSEVGSSNSLTFTDNVQPGQSQPPIKVHLEQKGNDPVDLVFDNNGNLTEYRPAKPASLQEGLPRSIVYNRGNEYFDGGRSALKYEMDHLPQINETLMRHGLKPISIRLINEDARRLGLPPLKENP